MKNTVPAQTQPTVDRDSLLLASLILKDVNQTIQGIHTIVAFLLRYITVGLNITDNIVAWITPMATEEQL